MFKSITIVVPSLVHALSKDGKCRILALRGGGVHGSFEVGVLKAFTELLDPEEIAYDYISGVSIGAVNGSILSTYPPGEERAAVEELETLYTKYSPSDYWNYWPYYIVEPFYKQSFVDNSKLLDILEEKLGSRPFKRKFCF